MAVTRFHFIFGTTDLSNSEACPDGWKYQIVCWCIGALSLPVNLIVKNVDPSNFKFMQNVNLEKVVDDEFINWFMGWFDSSVNEF